MIGHPLINEQKQLVLPPFLTTIFTNELKAIGKLNDAKDYIRKEADEGPIGGDTLDATIEHFYSRFSNSCIRLQYVVLDPDNKFKDVAEKFLSSFYSGDICLVDIPCGTGAASLSLLHTLCDLREAKLLPTVPLTVRIYAADYSNHVSGVFSNMMDASMPRFNELSIDVSYKIKHWDAFDISSTATLVDAVKKIECDEYFILISAFNGIGNERYLEMKPSLDLLQSAFSNESFSLVHIEPSSNKGISFLRKISVAVKSIFKELSFSMLFPVKARFEWIDPVNGRTVQSSVSVHLNRRDN
ncbi:hypothetical protein [Aliivibrio fischeri]|uniref:hypothetical protein n=1 Tax=Aliivibrio fischeri TaxID=668 RepID=UPI0012DA5CD7|nr:hypothetical protein [Aliivibrio fischeri]MUK64380.1 hypothetical protein [Aliivibrio fischeri]